MDYTKLASEARKLYHALRDEEFDAAQAYDITKFCVRDYPIFREMIEKEQSPEEAIGYVHFIAGDKTPIYSKKYNPNTDTTTLHTELGDYRIGTETVYDPLKFYPSVNAVYYAFDGVNWYRLYTIDHIEYL